MENSNSGKSPYIKAINKEAVHRICSGQVVLNLAVAVKELVENSLDAGATVIDVRLRDYGSELIEVTDNGSGVEPDNFQGLTLKHHTSKLQDFSDLVTVETFGFRGEALSSLCSLSDVAVTTRHVSSTCGTKLVFDHSGKIKSSSSVARQVGTTVSLENIFSTLPVRQKEFHKNLKREFGKMTQLLYAYCLVSTNVKITCTNQTKKGGRMPVASTQGCKTVKENITCVFGSKQLASLLEVKTVSPSSEVLEQLNLKGCEDVNKMFMLEGLVSSCGHGQGRAASDRQFYYVNSRPCEPTKVMKAVNEVYHQYNAHQQPFVFLNISSARDAVDVNVTPDKRQVFLEHEKLLVATVKASLQALYENIPSTYKMNNITSPALQRLTSPPVPSSPPISAAALLSQWHHSSPSKRLSSELPAAKIHKQAKLSKMFAKIENNPSSMLQTKKTSPTQSEDSDSLINKSNNVKGDEENFCLEILDHVAPKHVADDNGNTSVHNPKYCINFDSNSQSSLSSNSSSLSCSFPSDKSPLSDSKGSELTSIKKFQPQSNHERLTIVSEVLVENPTESCGVPPDLMSSPASINNDELNKCQVYEVPDFQRSIQKDLTCSSRNREVVEVSTTMADLREYSRRSLEQPDLAKERRVRFRALIEPTKNKLAEEELSREISKDMFAEMEVLGQFNLGFIIAKLNSDLFIVDQHASDEKYNFETLQRTTTISNQKLVVPQQLELTVVNESILIDNIKMFNANGFDFEIDENAPPTKKVKLSSIPMSHNWTFGKEDIDELLFMLQDAPANTICRPSRVRAMFASRACRKSVMIGTALSKAEMKRLLVHMGEIEQPWIFGSLKSLMNMRIYRELKAINVII